MSYFISEKCIGCGMCAKNCPIGIIEGESKKQHTINKNSCMECGVCGRVCPVSAIKDGAGEICIKIKKNMWPKPEFNLQQCFSCGACKEMCIERCIDMISKDGGFALKPRLTDKEKCVSCGACVSVCGVSAIKLV